MTQTQPANRSKQQQATHTPGPWHISPCYFGGILNHIEINGETDGIAVTKCEANARLIAAAPDLLAALEMAAVRLESGNEVDQACARHCRAAIAKSEGR